MLTFHGGMKIYPLHLNALTDPFTPQIRAILTALPTADHQTYDHPQTPIKAIANPAIAATIRLPAPRIADLYRENLPYFSRGYKDIPPAPERADRPLYAPNSGNFDGTANRLQSDLRIPPERPSKLLQKLL